MAAPTLDEKALVVALELLRIQVHDNALALAANTVRVSALTSWFQYNAELAANAVPSAPPAGAPATPTPAAPSVAPTPTPAPTPAAPSVAPTPTPAPTPSPGSAPVTGTPVATPALPVATPVATVVETAEQRRRRQESEDKQRSAESWRKAGGDLKQMASPLTDVFKTIAGRFAAVAAPMAILGQVLNSNVSGFQTLTTATKLVAGVLAPVLLPATLLLSTGFVAVAELFTGVGLPAFSALFEFLIDNCLPWIELYVQALQILTAQTQMAVASFKELSEFITFMTGLTTGRGNSESRARVDSALSDVLKSFRNSVGPRAQITGLGGVGQAAQLAALNNDPLEARLQRQTIAVLERIEAAINRRQQADRPGAPGRSFDPLSAGVKVRNELAAGARGVIEDVGNFFGL